MNTCQSWHLEDILSCPTTMGHALIQRFEIIAVASASSIGEELALSKGLVKVKSRNVSGANSRVAFLRADIWNDIDSIFSVLARRRRDLFWQKLRRMLLSKFKICFFGFRLSECPSVMSGIEFVQGSVVRNSGDVVVVSIKAKEGGKSRTGIPSSNQRVIVELQASLIIVMMFWLCGFRWFVYNLILVLDTTWRKTSFTSPPFFLPISVVISTCGNNARSASSPHFCRHWTSLTKLLPLPLHPP